MKNTIVALLLALGLVVSGALADTVMSFPAIEDAGITTLGEHTNRGGDSQISFCNGTVNSGEFGVFDFNCAAIQTFITWNLPEGLTLQDAINQSKIQVVFSLVRSGNVDPNAQVGVTSVYTDDNWIEGAGASGPGVTTPYNWPGAATGTPACTAAAPNDYVGQGYNWHRTDTYAGRQQLQNIPGVTNSKAITGWTANVRNWVQLDDALWCEYIFGKSNTDATVSVPLSTMLKTYGLPGGSSPMTCYTREAATEYAPMLTVIMKNNVCAMPPHPADANNDGAVDVVDLGILAKNYDRIDLPVFPIDIWGPGSSWRLGDFNFDGNVDVIDLGILSTNYDWSGAPKLPAPEPTTLSLLALGGLAIMRRAKKV